jgi:hypothetical protein
MNELTIDRISDAYRKALSKIKEPYRRAIPAPTQPAPLVKPGLEYKQPKPGSLAGRVPPTV